MPLQVFFFAPYFLQTPFNNLIAASLVVAGFHLHTTLNTDSVVHNLIVASLLVAG
jgi:hypothetical protein